MRQTSSEITQKLLVPFSDDSLAMRYAPTFNQAFAIHLGYGGCLVPTGQGASKVFRCRPLTQDNLSLYRNCRNGEIGKGSHREEFIIPTTAPRSQQNRFGITPPDSATTKVDVYTEDDGHDGMIHISLDHDGNRAGQMVFYERAHNKTQLTSCETSIQWSPLSDARLDQQYALGTTDTLARDEFYLELMARAAISIFAPTDAQGNALNHQQLIDLFFKHDLIGTQAIDGENRLDFDRPLSDGVVFGRTLPETQTTDAGVQNLMFCGVLLSKRMAANSISEANQELPTYIPMPYFELRHSHFFDADFEKQFVPIAMVEAFTAMFGTSPIVTP